MISALLDDGAGRIARAAIAVSQFSAQNFAEAIRSVLLHLPSEIELDVVVDASEESSVQGWLAETGRVGDVRFHRAPEGLNYSLWMQDPLLIRSDGSASISKAFDRYQDREIAELLRKSAGWQMTEPSIHIDGGNVVTHHGLTLISADTEASANALKAFDPMRSVVRIGTARPCIAESSRQTDRPLQGWTETLNYLSTEGTRQPIFHLDHMIAPAGTQAGKPRFLVGCPKLGAKAIGHPLWEHAQPDAFDEIAALLEALGAVVVRNPQPLAWVDRPERQFRRWFHLPVNNVLIHGDAVLLPCFINKTCLRAMRMNVQICNDFNL